MRPVIKVVIYGSVVTVLFLSVVALIFVAIRKDSLTIGLTDVVLFTAVTLFASLSKFAKEVIKILHWKMHKESFGTYPDTELKRKEMRHKLSARMVRPFAVRAAEKRVDYVCLEMKDGVDRDPAAIFTAKSEMLRSERIFLQEWAFLDHHNIRPINPNTLEPWKDAEAFLKVAERLVRKEADARREATQSVAETVLV
jgi:hypothetical protein